MLDLATLTPLLQLHFLVLPALCQPRAQFLLIYLLQCRSMLSKRFPSWALHTWNGPGLCLVCLSTLLNVPSALITPAMGFPQELC